VVGAALDDCDPLGWMTFDWSRMDLDPFTKLLKSCQEIMLGD
jgi:hypothetical protein